MRGTWDVLLFRSARPVLPQSIQSFGKRNQNTSRCNWVKEHPTDGDGCDLNTWRNTMKAVYSLHWSRQRRHINIIFSRYITRDYDQMTNDQNCFLLSDQTTIKSFFIYVQSVMLLLFLSELGSDFIFQYEIMIKLHR